jgi:hypothetical protein
VSETFDGTSGDDDTDHREPGPGREAAAGIAATLIGARLGGTLGAMAGAGMTPYLSPLVDKIIDEWRRDQQANIAEMAETAATTAGLDPEEFGERIGRSATTRLLTATAAESAAKTAWPPKVRALGRVLADGLIADDEAAIDLVQLALTAMTDLERPHVMVLDLLANYGVVNVTEDPAKGIPFQFEVEPARDVDVGDPRWIPDWRDRETLTARPQLEQAYLSIISTLQRHALIAQSSYRSGSWAATDIGKHVLAYYFEAAAQFD